MKTLEIQKEKIGMVARVSEKVKISCPITPQAGPRAVSPTPIYFWLRRNPYIFLPLSLDKKLQLSSYLRTT